LLAQAALCAPADGWTYEATPFLNAAGLSGTVGARGVTADVNLSFGDILDKLDIAFEAAFLARKGPLSLQTDLEFFLLSDDVGRSVTGPAGRATVSGELDATSKLWIWQANAGYRVLDDQTKVDLVGGMRLTGLEADLDLHGRLSVGDEVFGASRHLSGSRVWVDGVVGARVAHQLSDRVSLLGYVDAGAGGSDFTWQALAGVDWQFARGRTLKVGYRGLSWNYSSNSTRGASSGIVWDMKLHGPYVGLGIRF
jgi:opacity protein-like surface antigen